MDCRLQHQKRPMFSVILTGFLQISRALHGSLLVDNFKFLSISANSFFKKLKTPNRIKWFTGQISIPSNEYKWVHGFTGSEGQSTPFADLPRRSQTEAGETFWRTVCPFVVFADKAAADSPRTVRAVRP